MTSNAEPKAALKEDVRDATTATNDQIAKPVSDKNDKPALKYKSIEQAKNVLAQDARTEFEMKRAEQRREHHILHHEIQEKDEHARKEAKHSKENMDEYADRLMEEMKRSVVKRYEHEYRAIIQASVVDDFETNQKAKIQAALRIEIYENLYQELKPVVEAKLEKDLCKAVKKKLEEEIRPVITAQITQQILKENNLKATEPSSITTTHNGETGDSSAAAQEKSPKDPRETKPSDNTDASQSKIDASQQSVDPDLAQVGVEPSDTEINKANIDPQESLHLESPDHNVNHIMKNPLKRSADEDSDTTHDSTKRAKLELDDLETPSTQAVTSESTHNADEADAPGEDYESNPEVEIEEEEHIEASSSEEDSEEEDKVETHHNVAQLSNTQDTAIIIESDDEDADQTLVETAQVSMGKELYDADGNLQNVNVIYPKGYTFDEEEEYDEEEEDEEGEEDEEESDEGSIEQYGDVKEKAFIKKEKTEY